MEIKEFLHVNRLKQKELAEFLGIGEPSVSHMVKGRTKPSKENLQKILRNDKGWDVSMLMTDNIVGDIVGNTAPVKVDQSKHLVSGDTKKEMGLLIKIAELTKEIEQLKERLADKDAQIHDERKRFNDLLEMYKTR